MGFSPNHPVEDSEYLLGRAEAEAALALNARTERAAAAHHRLASVYLDKLFGDAKPRAACDRRQPAAGTAPDDAERPATRGYFVDPGALPDDIRLTHLLNRLS